MIVDDGCQVESNIVFGHAHLLRHLCDRVSPRLPLLLVFIHTHDLDLHVDLNEFLTQRVDLDQPRVNSSIESTKFSDEANITL